MKLDISLYISRYQNYGKHIKTLNYNRKKQFPRMDRRLTGN